MRKEFVIYEILEEGKKVILDAPHAKEPKADEFTGEIAKSIAESLKIPYVVSNVSRKTEADLNRDFGYPLPFQNEARKYYIDVIRKIYNVSSKPVLHIALHGMQDTYGYDFIIGIKNGKICDLETAEKFRKLLQLKAEKFNLNPKIAIDKIFPGDNSLISLKNEIGNDYKIIQLEISRRFRTSNFMNDLLTEVISEFI